MIDSPLRSQIWANVDRSDHEIHRGDGHATFVVGVGTPPIPADGHAVRQVPGLKAHAVGGPEGEPPTGVEAGPHDVVAPPTDDQKSGASGVGIDGYQVVTKSVVAVSSRASGSCLATAGTLLRPPAPA